MTQPINKRNIARAQHLRACNQQAHNKKQKLQIARSKSTSCLTKDARTRRPITTRGIQQHPTTYNTHIINTDQSRPTLLIASDFCFPHQRIHLYARAEIVFEGIFDLKKFFFFFTSCMRPQKPMYVVRAIDVQHTACKT